MSTADEAEGNVSGSASDSAPTTMESEVGWRNYITEDLPRSVQQSADSAIQSARNIQHSSANHLRSIQDFIPQMGARYKHYEESFFHQVKDGLMNVKEHPAAAAGVALTAFLLLRGPRRFLYRQTLGRLQSEEAQFNRAEKSLKEFSISVDLMKKESQKLLERSALAEKDMKRGHFDLTDAGTQIHKLARSVSKAESEAADLMDMLREIPGREALKLRADVASMKSHLRQQRLAMHKRVLKISELGVPV